MAVRVAINGFGRIGRLVLRAARTADDLRVVAVNDLADARTLGHLLTYDSVHGRLPAEVVVKGEEIAIDGQMVRALVMKDPARLPVERAGGGRGRRGHRRFP
jgi:glyceraldehyde 3-phosphate dehydrogenase